MKGIGRRLNFYSVDEFARFVARVNPQRAAAIEAWAAPHRVTGFGRSWGEWSALLEQAAVLSCTG